MADDMLESHDVFGDAQTDGMEVEDPFSKDLAPAFQLITLMRLYDVGMALLVQLEAADENWAAVPPDERPSGRIANAHASGKLVADFPYLSPDEA